MDGSSGPTALSQWHEYVERLTFAPNSDVHYQADLSLAPTAFRVPLDGSAPPEVVNEPVRRNLSSIEFAGHGRTVIYIGDPDSSFVTELFSRARLAVDRVTPSRGSFAGGAVVSIEGLGFTATTAVSFGGIPAIDVTRVAGDRILATVPPRPIPPKKRRLGFVQTTVNIVLTDGGARAIAPDAFTYERGR